MQLRRTAPSIARTLGRSIRTWVCLVGMLASACLGDEGSDKPAPSDGGSAGHIILGVPDMVDGTTFVALPPGGDVVFAASGQAALLLQFAFRTRNMGSIIAGTLTIATASGTSLVRTWERLLLYCLPDMTCEQVPVYFPITGLDDPSVLDGQIVTLKGAFTGMNGATASLSTTAVLRKI
jgi:hypothetical protein